MLRRYHGERQKEGARLTLFGEKVREIRRGKGLLLLDMAHVAEVSPGFLSLVETGKKAIPETLVAKLVTRLELDEETEAELQEAAALSAREFRIHLDGDADPQARRVAFALQNGFAKMSASKKAKILDLLEDD